LGLSASIPSLEKAGLFSFVPPGHKASDFRKALRLGCVHRSAHSLRAFTLLELTVVVILIGILSALIIPEMRGTYEEELLRSTSRDLIDAFHVAYSRAVSFNQLHRFHLNPATHRYTLERRVWDNGQEDFIPVRDVPGAEGQLDERISVRIHVSDSAAPMPADRGSSASSPSPSAEELSFYPDGTAEAAELLLEDRQGFRLLLRLNPATARVRILELPRL
jgi:prepilin-type N-terminal cleavage/methylation domain-containing protein